MHVVRYLFSDTTVKCVRIKIKLEPVGGRCVIPFSHQYQLASVLYRKMYLADEEYARELHMSGGFKHFTFSWLHAPKRHITDEGVVCEGEVYMYCSSPSTALMHMVSDGFRADPNLSIGSAHFELRDVETMPEVKIGSSVRFRTLTPILVRTVKNDARTVDLSPKEPLFYTNLIANLQKRYELYTGKRGRVGVVSVDRVKPKRIQIKNTYNRAYMMDIEMRGSPYVLRYAYDVGLGEKNSMGFGMVKTAR